MAHSWFSRLFAAAFFAAFFVTNAVAESDFINSVQTPLYVGNTAKAASIAKARLAEAPNDDQARFALGAVQFLQAVEHLGQALHRHGLQSSYEDEFGLTGLPILRLPVPDNPNPSELTYDAFRDILETFASKLATANATLGEISNQKIELQLNIGLIRLDLNGDGKGTEDEALWRVFAIVAGAEAWLNKEAAKDLLIDFDGSDVPWLQAYCHLLTAIVEFPLAHDWREAFDATFPSIFHMPSSVADRGLKAALAEARKKLAEIGPLPPENPSKLPMHEWSKTPEGEEYYRILWLRRPYEERLKSEIAVYSGIADLIAFIHLNHWPVVEPERMASVLGHLEEMVRLSRENWNRILAETDNGNEWIPNPKQTGTLPRMTVTQERVDGWQNFLGEFEAILKGTRLIPHWRYDEGINMRRLFLEPRTFDIVLLIQGSAALPYLEKGELTNKQTWDQISNLLGGDFFRYFIWFN